MHTFIFDIGKTNLKATVLNTLGDVVWQNSVVNNSSEEGDYLSIASETQWQWLQQQLQQAYSDVGFGRINISTHGACAALVDEHGELVLPVMDYESPLPEQMAETYNALRPPFTETFSPKLGLGLNLGAQLHWLKHQYPEAYRRTTHLLMYPQYFAYLLTGIACHEITSLGCHTDLWNTRDNCYSSLVEALDLNHKCPPMHPAHAPLGKVSGNLAKRLGLDPTIDVFPGVHDSNAGLARYLYCSLPSPLTVISSGTWIISMAVGHPVSDLQAPRDMLANIDVNGTPTACARFMGGREFQRITTALPMRSDDMARSIAELILRGIYIAPGVEADSGPITQGSGSVMVINSDGRQYSLDEAKDHLAGDALATLYLASMLHLELKLLNARGPIVFGSIAQKNPWLVKLVAQLRPDQPVMVSSGDASTVTGAWCLTRWQETCPPSLDQFSQVIPSNVDGLVEYIAKAISIESL